MKPFLPWLERADRDPRDELYLEEGEEFYTRILAWCKDCDLEHVAMWDYDEWCHIEWCKDGNQISGESIEFDYWYPLFESPSRLKEYRIKNGMET